MLDVLIGVDEVGAKIGEVSTRGGVSGCLAHTNRLAAERCLGGAHDGVPTDLEGDLGTVDGTGVPLLDEQDDDMGPVGDPEGPVLTELGRPAVAHDNRRTAVASDLHDDVLECRLLDAGTGEGDLDRGVEFDVIGNDDVAGGMSGIGRGHHRDAILWRLGEVVEPGRIEFVHLHRFRRVDRPVEARRGRLFGKHGGELGDGSESPGLFVPGGHGMIGNLPGRGGMEMGLDVAFNGDVVFLVGWSRRALRCAQRNLPF